MRKMGDMKPGLETSIGFNWSAASSSTMGDIAWRSSGTGGGGGSMRPVKGFVKLSPICALPDLGNVRFCRGVFDKV